MVTFSCTDGTDLCIQTSGPPSIQAGEMKACAMFPGMTFAMTPCPTAGSLGCCVDADGMQEQCAYSSMELFAVQGFCKSPQTWAGPEGGVAPEAGAGDVAAEAASGVTAFIGTWSRSGTESTVCPGGTTMSSFTGNLLIGRGLATDTVIGTQPDGCMITYTVSGNVATATPGQSCNITTEGGVAETITVTTHTLTLSADGLTLMAQGSDTIDKTMTMTMCTRTSTGTLTKQ
jgi:hypothetical protein